jgi:Protein of unknown function (DUF2752)
MEWLLILAGTVGLIYLYFNDPRLSHFYPPCIFHRLFGIWCPGCGLTRGTYCLMHFEFKEALNYNLLLMCASPFIAYDGIIWFLNKGEDAKYKSLMGERMPAWILFVVVILFTVLRNLPYPPFNLLAP